MLRTLYLTRNGLLEPLGQSQILAYLRGLSRECEITLITYEKPEDWADGTQMERAREICKHDGIRWLPQKFRPHPRIVAPAFSMLRMAWLVWREARGGHVGLIHARSYIPAAVALFVHRMTGVPFIFDMRALWPEELITAGRLRRGSLLHRAISAAERACLKRAAGIVSLTEAAVDHLKDVYPEELRGKTITVIPTCADLDRFTSADITPTKPVHSCIGTLMSGWFKVDWLRSWFETVAANDQDARFEILTRDDPNEVRVVLDPKGLLTDRLSISSRRSSEMPNAVKEHTVSVMFFTGGLSKLGSSPTRMAEVLGTGLPVIANNGVGDLARIVSENRVGILVEDNTPEQMAAAYEAFLLLQQDPDLAARCRQTAEAVFSLEAGTERYRKLYQEILDGART